MTEEFLFALILKTNLLTLPVKTLFNPADSYQDLHNQFKAQPPLQNAHIRTKMQNQVGIFRWQKNKTSSNFNVLIKLLVVARNNIASELAKYDCNLRFSSKSYGKTLF